jgi:hypothetical protein
MLKWLARGYGIAFPHLKEWAFRTAIVNLKNKKSTPKMNAFFGADDRN